MSFVFQISYYFLMNFDVSILNLADYKDIEFISKLKENFNLQCDTDFKLLFAYYLILIRLLSFLYFYVYIISL